ncbi:sensor domain-containing diguanylate cyclase [Sulfurimonas sp. C5]|uniref:sensor domain-containing diguanylate cyclase n=1 Tax=Sulfurimonas sp. C5 TaxID=3036947 RepID=UPI002455FCE8|nr:sensor domain-containing diguanylate cyclase [Sulfurimonas sp. C5]MDH4943782.1 diguanylate cyclase [Sulfurimonas sp. C5]
MNNKLRLNSLQVQLSLIIFVTVSILFGIHSFYVYVQTKKELDHQIKTEITRNLDSISGSIAAFMEAYSPNEYQTIIAELIQKQDILAIVVHDYKMQKILGESDYKVGYIKEQNRIKELNFQNIKQMKLLASSYYKESLVISNKQGQEIGKITFYISDDALKAEIEEIIFDNIRLALLISSIMIVTLLFSIHYFIVNRLTNIINVINTRDDYGLPLQEIESQGSIEIRYIIDTINNMIGTIKGSRLELQENYKLLQDERDRFQLAIEATNDGIWDWNLKTNEVFFSERWKSMLGYHGDEIGNHVDEWKKRVHSEDLEKVIKDVQAHLNGETELYENEHRVQHKDGHWVWILDRGKALFDSNGEAYRMLGFHTDMTQRHMFIETLKAEQQRYKNLLELSSDGIHLLDTNGKLYEYSNSFLKMLGYTKEEAKNLNVKDWDVSIPKEKILPTIHELMVRPNSFETVHRRKDGSTFIANVNAKGIIIDGQKYLYASVRDVTKEKEHQLEIRNKLQKVIDSQSSIVIVTDAVKLRFVNRRFLEFFGYKYLENYLQKHRCISEKFIEQEKFFDLGKIHEGEKNWIESLLNLSGRQRIVAMRNNEGILHAFNVSINKFEKDEYIVGFTDITDTMTENLELAQQASIDTLTNAYNRAYFNNNIEYILKRHKNENMYTGIIMFDIDKFKDVNDTYGHDVGDYVLKTLIQIVQRYTRNPDKIIRWGGEEFIIVCATQDKTTLGKIAEYLRSMIESYKFDYVDNITCSFGCALHEQSQDILKTIKEADVKLYQAKEEGRNKVVC